MSERVASVDIGSNSVLMLLAERDTEGVWRRLEDHVRVTRISEGLDQSGVLAPEPVARTRRTLIAFAAAARRAEVSRVWITGTAPFRRAANGAEVAESFADIFGVAVTVVSGEREAELSLLATQKSFPHLDPMLVVDIGGASTEIILSKDGGSRMVSLDIGSVRLTERCVSANPIPAADLSALRQVIEAELDRTEVTALLRGPSAVVVGIAGTVTTVATVSLGMERYDETLIHGHRLETSAIGELAHALASESVEARALRPGLPSKRADVLPAGAFLLARIAEVAEVSEVLVSDRGTRWGRLYAET